LAITDSVSAGLPVELAFRREWIIPERMRPSFTFGLTAPHHDAIFLDTTLRSVYGFLAI